MRIGDRQSALRSALTNQYSEPPTLLW